MKNFDREQLTAQELRQNMFEAFASGDEAKMKEAFEAFAENLSNNLTNEAKKAIENNISIHNDNQILINRGIQFPLTSKEMKYFENAVLKEGFDGVEEAFPTTIIETVFDDLRTNHPLLKLIDMRQTGVLTKLIYADPTKVTAFWGEICADIRQMILEGFKRKDFSSSKLSGFVAVCKGYTDLGPAWLARYIIELMYEIMEMELEIAVVNGTGENQPIGMMRKLSGAVDSVYPEKDAIAITELTPTSLGPVRGALASAMTDRGGTPAFIVNPETYWVKLYSNLAFQDAQGQWHYNNLPAGFELIESHAVPVDKAVIGVPKNYVLGVASDVKIEKYTETLAIEDLDLYIAKFFGWGVAKNKNAFFVLDLSGVPGETMPPLETDVVEVP